MSFSRRARNMLRRTGIDVSLYDPALDAKRNYIHQLKSNDVSVVLDVGANSGQYAAGLRADGFGGRIVSFEPLKSPYARLQARAARDPLWDCRRCALGDSDGTITINVAGNSGESSSVLPMLESHREACPPANYIGTETVPIHRLDSISGEIIHSTDVIFLKIDVQGFEKHVLAGAESVVDVNCVGMQLELSFVPLYDGGMLIREALDTAYSMGFALTGLSPCFTDLHNGRMLQADGIFFRTVT